MYCLINIEVFFLFDDKSFLQYHKRIMKNANEIIKEAEKLLAPQFEKIEEILLEEILNELKKNNKKSK